MEQGTVDRQLTASTMRTSGKEGETLLLKLLKFHKSEKVRMAAASVLSFRLQANETQLPLDILLDSSDSLVSNYSQFAPGQVCKYKGPVTSLILEEPSNNSNNNNNGFFLKEDAVMEVSMRDFLASLNRMLSLESNSSFFAEQFNSEIERDLVIEMLTHGE